jgi:hypothetical protein
MKAFRNLFRSSPPQVKHTQIGLVCNFTACELGTNLQTALSQNLKTVGVAHNCQEHESSVDAFLNEQTDRDRVISYLNQNNYQVKYLIFNQPFKLRPTVDDPLKASSDDEKEESAVLQLKQKVSILVETPLFTVSDLKQAGTLASDCRVLLLQHPQIGMM